MKEKLIEYLLASKKHWQVQQQKANDALAMIEYELDCINCNSD